MLQGYIFYKKLHFNFISLPYPKYSKIFSVSRFSTFSHLISLKKKYDFLPKQSKIFLEKGPGGGGKQNMCSVCTLYTPGYILYN